MTIIDAIQKTDTLKPNRYSQDEKIRWLSLVDTEIKSQIIDKHEDGSDVEFLPYNENTPLDKTLLVPHPFDDLYLYWLSAQIDYWDREMVMYNNHMGIYNSLFNDYERYYNRIHMPLGQKINYFGS